MTLAPPALPTGSDFETIRDGFLIDRAWTFLNHGSFGACPRSVLSHQQDLRHRLEQQPIRFFIRQLLPLLDEARATIARFVHADPESVAFVDNATSGVNTVLRSLDLGPEDELLTTNHDYHACRMALEYVASRTGARVRVAEVPFPLEDPQQVVEAVLASVNDRTRLCLIDAVTSATGTIFPFERLVAALNERGVESLVDGAHALAMLDLDLGSLGATYFTANCHKWLCSPKGAAILVVDESVRDRIHPLTISYGGAIPIPKRSLFHREFDWKGTHDPTPFLAAGRAVDAIPSLFGGDWATLRRYNRDLVLYGRARLLEALQTLEDREDYRALAPVPESMIGSIASIPLPPRAARPVSGYAPSDALYDALIEAKFEVPVFHWPASPRRFIRISAQIYNRPEEYDRLAEFVAAFESGS